MAQKALEHVHGTGKAWKNLEEFIGPVTHFI